MTAACNFVFLGVRMRELWIEQGKERKREEKENEKLLIAQLDKKGKKLSRFFSCTVAWRS